MRSYRIGEISKMLDVPVETIRFLEQKGLISPNKNAENGYRYYNVWDANQILDYKKFRQIGFSSKETVALVKNCEIKELIDKLEEKRLEASYLAYFYQAKAQKLRNFQEVIANAEGLVGKYFIMNRPENYSLFVRTRDEKGLQISTAKETEGGYEELTRHYPFVEHIYRIRKDNLLSPVQSDEAQWGFTVKKKWADRLDIQLLPKMEHIKSAPSVFTIIRVGEKQYFTADLLDGVFRFMNEKGYELDGDIIGIYLAAIHENNENIRYMEVWSPVKAADRNSGSLTLENSSLSVLKQIFC